MISIIGSTINWGALNHVTYACVKLLMCLIFIYSFVHSFNICLLNNPNEAGSVNIRMATLQRNLFSSNNMTSIRAGHFLRNWGGINAIQEAIQELSIAACHTMGKLGQLMSCCRQTE